MASLQGKVILFYNLLPSGDMDEYSLHGGCKVEEGEKWCVSLFLAVACEAAVTFLPLSRQWPPTIAFRVPLTFRSIRRAFLAILRSANYWIWNNDNPNRRYEAASFHTKLSKELEGTSLPLSFPKGTNSHDEL